MSSEMQKYPHPVAVTTDRPEVPAQRVPSETSLSVFGSEAGFIAGQRMAKMLSAASLVPDAYRGESGLPNAIIAIDMAQRMGANPLMIMQNLYIVHGRPAWSSQFLIACLNSCGRFSPLRYILDGDGDNYGCRAVANDKVGNLHEGPRVSIGIAKAEGWATRSGSKWKTLPDLMLRYRAATFFARTYAPELTMGIPTSEEIIDIDGDEPPQRRGAGATLKFPVPAEKSEIGDPAPPFGDDGKGGV